MKSAIPLTKTQFDFLLTRFKEQQDFRLEAILYLLSRPMRIGEVLALKVEQLYDVDGEVRQELHFKEEKTGHLRVVPIWGDLGFGMAGLAIKDCLERLYQDELRNLPRTSWAFLGRKRKSKLSKSGFWFLINQFQGECKLDSTSGHGVRKFIGKWLHNEKGVSLETLQELYGHSDIRSTKKYVQVETEVVRKAQTIAMF